MLMKWHIAYSMYSQNGTLKEKEAHYTEKYFSNYKIETFTIRMGLQLGELSQLYTQGQTASFWRAVYWLKMLDPTTFTSSKSATKV